MIDLSEKKQVMKTFQKSVVIILLFKPNVPPKKVIKCFWSWLKVNFQQNNPSTSTHKFFTLHFK